MDEHIALPKTLQGKYDLLPSTINTYTRLGRYEEAIVGAQKPIRAGTSELDDLPAVNHGTAACHRTIELPNKPIQIRHGTPGARLLVEIAMAGGFTSYEGSDISYNILYARRVALEKLIRDWWYCGRPMGLCKKNDIRINREPLDPLTSTLTPPSMSHPVAIIESLLALEQGVKSITVGHSQVGSLTQDIAATQALRELSHGYFHGHGSDDYGLSTVLHR